ncbi:hypothetical protein CR513_53134, partial [Mucuna pruriens]
MPLDLVPTVSGKPLILYLTVLEESMGYVLGQLDAFGKKEQQEIQRLQTKIPGARVNLLCSSLGSKKAETVYATHTMMLISKTDPLKYIFQKLALTRKIARWKMALLECDIVYISQKVIKGSALAEQLAHHPLSDYQPLLHEFPDKHIMAVEEIKSKSKTAEWKL